MSLILRKFRGKQLTTKQAISLIVGSAALVFIFIALVVHFAKPKPQKVEAKAEPELTVQDAFGALFRSMSADKICYDKGRNGYFVHFPDDENLKPWGGWWWYIDSPTFYSIEANNTWFVSDIPDSKLTRVYPVVDGIPCAASSEYQNK